MTDLLSPGLLLAVPLAPLIGALIAGLFGRTIGRTLSHCVTILGVLIAWVLSIVTLMSVLHGAHFDAAIYTWSTLGDRQFQVGFLIDSLTATMMVVVTFVSLMVHVYTIGYMSDDPGYQRFFAYISLFTFSMLMLVMSNNLLQLFFGWEAVGLMSYLLIGFWYTKPTAIFANLKAFLVNRVGDFGFILGIGLLLSATGTLHYADIFTKAPELVQMTVSNTHWSLLTVACICLFIGAMGKSAQFPLHVWLPDSMEGPTPISALIHAATMVTAGIFMVARMSPLFELSDTALSFVMIIGSITAFFMGLLGIVQNDIKRVVAYSTLSQLGYMTVALGVSAYPVAIFHLMTHAFFKALLFLGAGSVILGMHHDQDIRHMGGLWKYMKLTWLTFLIGSLALIGTPFFAGFYSKDSIIDAVGASTLPGHWIAYASVLGGVFITAFYSFRLYFLVFHGPERFRQHAGARHADRPAAAAHTDHRHDPAHGAIEPHESPLVVTLPLVALAIFSVTAGYIIKFFLYGDFFKGVIDVSDKHPAMHKLAEEYRGILEMSLGSVMHPTLWLAIFGVVAAWYMYLRNPAVPGRIQKRFFGVYTLLDNKYYLDQFNQVVFAGGARLLGRELWKRGDQQLIDGVAVNGSAHAVGWFSSIIRKLQSGLLSDYAMTMILGVLVFISWFVIEPLFHDRPHKLQPDAAVGSLEKPDAQDAGMRQVAGSPNWWSINDKNSAQPGITSMPQTVPYLSLSIWIPIATGLLILAIGSDTRHQLVRVVALLGSLVGFAVTVPLYTKFDNSSAALQFVENQPWVERFHAFYSLGVDGLSLWFVLLTALITVIVVVAGWQVIQKNVSAYYAAFLILSGLMIGVFEAADGLLFYVFFESTLIPMFIIIGVWGGPNRVYAAIKFFLYTLLGSLLTLVAILYLWYKSGGSFEIRSWQDLSLPLQPQILIFFAFLMAFAVKVPMWPVHTWLPDAHVEAPTGGSVVLAAIMLKLGAYGFVRFSLPIAPDASHELSGFMITLSLIAVIYIGLVAMVQTDMKKLVAYSSIAHMGFVTLGFFIFLPLGMEGGLVQMVSHGFVSAAMFLCIGVLYDRMHTRLIADYGGVVNVMPKFAAFMMLFAMANCGLPATSGFVGEWYVILGAVDFNFWIGLLAATALILGAAYSLWMYKRVIFGPVENPHVAALKDINAREFSMLAVLAALTLFMGLWPKPFTDVMHASVADLEKRISVSKVGNQ